VLDRCTGTLYRVDLGTYTADPIVPGLGTSRTTGFLAAKPLNQSTLWLTEGGGDGNVTRVQNADTTHDRLDFPLGDLDEWGDNQVAGPIAVTSTGHAYVIAVDSEDAHPGGSRTSVGIYEIIPSAPADPPNDVHFVDSLSLPGAAVQAQDLAVTCTGSGSGHLYIATQGNGVIDVALSNC
jgi:hypothetical protein